MQLKLNREFAARHLFVAALMAAMGGWFAYDGYVKYPSMTPEALYASCHNGAQAASPEAARRFRESAIPRQKQFMALCFAASVVVGLGVLRAARFRFSYDGDGFDFGGRRQSLDDITGVDASRWEKKGILKLSTKGGAVTLDAWHHAGVDGFYEILEAAGRVPAKQGRERK